MKGLLLGAVGGFFSFFMFLVLQNAFALTDVQGFILDATIVLTVVICSCTGLILEKLKSLK